MSQENLTKSHNHIKLLLAVFYNSGNLLENKLMNVCFTSLALDDSNDIRDMS